MINNFTPAEIRQIKRFRRSGMTMRKIAFLFNVTCSPIYRVLRRAK